MAWSAEMSLRALLEQPRQLLTVVLAAIAAALIGSELFSLLNTALTAPPAISRVEGRIATDPVATITQAGLFGTSATQPTNTDDGLLPQTSMQMTLRGVFTGRTPEQGSAIFELPDGSTRMARAGGNLADGVVLERIYPGRVVLNRNGLQENLSFPTAEEYADSVPEAVATAPSGEGSFGGAVPETLSDDEKRTNILRRLEELRARSLERNQG